MAYTEFYCDPSTGNNMYGGAPIGGIYPKSYTNGGWNSGTGVFTPAAGDPAADGITVGDFAAVFVDGVTTPAFVGRVTARSTTTITVSITIKIGTIPTTGAAGITCTVGGAWKGPNAAVNWPAGSITNALVNSSSNPVRVNMKNNATYAITAVVTSNQTDITFQGYSSTVGDGGRATIDGSTSTIVLWTQSSARCWLVDLIFSNNGASGTNNGVSITAQCVYLYRCVVHDIRRSGFVSTNGGVVFQECEAYICNSSNTASASGFECGANITCINCVSHNNAGSNSSGFIHTAGTNNLVLTLINCISETNGGHGAISGSTSTCLVAINCDFYNNAGAGIFCNGNTAAALAINCNFVKNTSNGVTAAASGTVPVLVVNCGFGAGTQANLATTAGRCAQEISSVTYAANVTPWIDPANGDFRINLAAAIGTGRGAFTETQASYTGTAANPVIGACQVAGYPAVTDVANAVTYANAAYTGTLAGGGGGAVYHGAMNGGCL